MYKFLFVAFILLSVFFVVSRLYEPLGSFLNAHESVVLGIMVSVIVFQEIYLYYCVYNGDDKNASPQ